MNPGPLDDAGKVALNTVDALKSMPVLLALVVFNVLYMGGTFYMSHTNGSRFERMLNLCYGAKESMRLQSDDSKPVELPPKEP